MPNLTSDCRTRHNLASPATPGQNLPHPDKPYRTPPRLLIHASSCQAAPYLSVLRHAYPAMPNRSRYHRTVPFLSLPRLACQITPLQNGPILKHLNARACLHRYRRPNRPDPQEQATALRLQCAGYIRYSPVTAILYTQACMPTPAY